MVVFDPEMALYGVHVFTYTITQTMLELGYDDKEIQHISHYATLTPPPIINEYAL